MEMLESISVIGGADGPTSIFLAGVINKVTNENTGLMVWCLPASLYFS